MFAKVRTKKMITSEALQLTSSQTNFIGSVLYSSALLLQLSSTLSTISLSTTLLSNLYLCMFYLLAYFLLKVEQKQEQKATSIMKGLLSKSVGLHRCNPDQTVQTLMSVIV